MNLLKQATILGVISSLVMLTPLTSEALTVEEVTNPQSANGTWVTDTADILTYETEADLNRSITKLEQTNGAEIAVVTVPETAPADSPKAFATELFNYWGIGKADVDNGILFLISEGELRVEIETGYGMEKILPDVQVKNIIDTKVTPQYKRGNYDTGTLDATEALISAINYPATKSSEILFPNNINWKALFAYLFTFGMYCGGIGLLWWKKSPKKVFINPKKAIVSLNRNNVYNLRCAKCRQSLEIVKVYNNKLTKAQQVAKKIGSVLYEGGKCSRCYPLQPYTLLKYISASIDYQKCSKCEEQTIIRTTKTLKEATYTSKGQYQKTYRCHCCDYLRETTQSIPRIRRSTSSGSYGGGGCSGGSSGGGSSGGDFGGGSSGGSSGGGDW